jgi:hypothetical protein
VVLVRSLKTGCLFRIAPNVSHNDYKVCRFLWFSSYLPFPSFSLRPPFIYPQKQIWPSSYLSSSRCHADLDVSCRRMASVWRVATPLQMSRMTADASLLTCCCSEIPVDLLRASWYRLVFSSACGGQVCPSVASSPVKLSVRLDSTAILPGFSPEAFQGSSLSALCQRPFYTWRLFRVWGFLKH